MRTSLTKILTRSIPVWMVLILVLDSALLTGLGQYYFSKWSFKSEVKQLSATTQNSDQLVEILKQQVLPPRGYTTSIKWKDLGKQLVESGVIDKQKYQEAFANDPESLAEMKHLDNSSDDNMVINEGNSRFMVNTLWALGLVNKSQVLDEGPMKTEGDLGNFASTGGWTLGTKEATALYSSKEIIQLTSKQQDLVKKIAENVFRSCCNNPTSFPDCNHGMAALGYIELAVKAGLPEKQIYQDLLALNSFWFPQNYVQMAAYFSQQAVSSGNKQNFKWDKVDAKLALSKEYSSGQGAQRIQQSVQDIPAFQSKGSGCAS